MDKFNNRRGGETAYKKNTVGVGEKKEVIIWNQYRVDGQHEEAIITSINNTVYESSFFFYFVGLPLPLLTTAYDQFARTLKRR